MEDFEAIVEKHGDFVYNVAYRILSNPHDAEEAAQEAFISAYKAFGRFRGESQVTTWLYRIAVNSSLMRLRKEKKARLLNQTGYDDMQIVDWTGNPERASLDSELRERLEEGFSRLPPDLRAAVALRDVQELSNEEAAESLDITVLALKARLHRGRILLRKHLSDYMRAGSRA